MDLIMRLIQFRTDQGSRAVAIAGEDGRTLSPLSGPGTVVELANLAIREGSSLAEMAEQRRGTTTIDYEAVASSGRLLPPVDHHDPAHCWVTGTGLTHLGSAAARDKMHAKLSTGAEELTDSLKMFRLGLEGGKPKKGEIGVQPEWFYKGDGSVVVAPGQPFTMPSFALDGGEEPEVAGIYLVGPDGTPHRLGFALGNEFSDHVMERQNYLYLAHSKLRQCAVGPELRLGPLPDHVEGTSRIRRDGKVLWEKPFLSGESNMSHTVDNLEAHHFKYRLFRRPGDLHIHFFGTATLSVADGIKTQEGDRFEIESKEFGRALVNPLARAEAQKVTVKAL
jgi:hypothetical protein